MSKSDAGSRDETPERRQSGEAGSLLCMANERQNATATKENIRSATTTLMEEVLRRENLQKALKRVRSNKGPRGQTA